MKFRKTTKERLLAEIAERMRVEEQLRAANRTLHTINRCNEARVRATDENALTRMILATVTRHTYEGLFSRN